jgi:hypothetical protein
MKQPKKPTRSTDSIPQPTYKNMKMFANIRNKQMGSKQPITKNDSLVYKQGYDFGINHPGGMKNPPANENPMFRAGRWEGQNTGKAINIKEATRTSLTQRAINAIKDYFEN